MDIGYWSTKKWNDCWKTGFLDDLEAVLVDANRLVNSALVAEKIHTAVNRAEGQVRLKETIPTERREPMSQLKLVSCFVELTPRNVAGDFSQASRMRLSIHNRLVVHSD
uniref:Uncharacterized protein n=1 Tax=Trichuris muris TaxID=70415 RepID=A0A5S6QGI6_TRIMR